MALRFSAQVPVGGRTDFCSATLGSSALVAEEPSCSKCFYRGAVFCRQGPVLKSRVSSERSLNASVSSLSSSHESSKSVNQYQGSSTTYRNKIFINQSALGGNSTALIDVEDCRDGSISFKYGALEDLWDLDRLLEYLCRGALRAHSAESFVPLIVEMLGVPVSIAGQRRMVELLSTQIRLNRNVTTTEMEKMVSQLLAEATSEYLPPPDAGSYSKGRSRPLKRFTSRMDKWWKNFDMVFGDVPDSGELPPEDYVAGLVGFQMPRLEEYGKLKNRGGCDLFRPDFTETLGRTLDSFRWRDVPSETSWLTYPADRLSFAPSKTLSLDFVQDSDTSLAFPADDTECRGFIWLSSQVSTLENVLRETEIEETTESEILFAPPVSTLENVLRDTEIELDSGILFAPPVGTLENAFRETEIEETIDSEILLAPSLVTNVETLPTSSIEAMVDWERKDAFVMSSAILPTREASHVKNTGKKSTQRSRSKAIQTQRARGKTSTSKPTSKKRHTDRLDERQLCDMFFGLPLSHKCSGVSGFLVMRKDHSAEMLVVLNQVAVVLAGAGLAGTLHVVARMLKLNSTFDSTKLFGLIRGAALLWLSAAMQSLRRVMMRLPPGCTLQDFKDNTQLLCLQQRLRSLSFRALTVVVLTVVSHGV